MRSLTYAYPTSDTACKHGRSKTGCYVLQIDHHEYPIDSPANAVRRFEEFDHHSTAPDSFFGPMDSDADRRSRMLAK